MTGHFTSYETRTDHELATLRRERLAIFARHDTLTRKRLAALLPMAGAGPLNDTLAALVSEGRLLRDGGTLRLHIPAREAALAQARASAVETATSRLAEALRSAGLSPPDPAQLAPASASARLLEGLVRDGIAIRATGTVQKRCFLFHRDAVDLAKRRLAPLLSQAPGCWLAKPVRLRAFRASTTCRCWSISTLSISPAGWVIAASSPNPLDAAQIGATFAGGGDQGLVALLILKIIGPPIGAVGSISIRLRQHTQAPLPKFSAVLLAQLIRCGTRLTQASWIRVCLITNEARHALRPCD